MPSTNRSIASRSPRYARTREYPGRRSTAIFKANTTSLGGIPSSAGQFYLNEIGRTIDWKTGYYHHLRLIAQERDFYRKSIQYSINTPFGQTVMPENRKTVLLETLEKYRHVTVNDNMRFIVEIFSKLECEVLNDWFRSDAPTDLVRWTDDLVSLVPDRLYRALRIDEPGGTSAG